MKIRSLNGCFIQITLIFLFIFFYFFRLIIQPLNLVLGIICLLIIPGYNLTKIFKPNINFNDRLGYTTILSLALINILMFIIYFFSYDITRITKNNGNREFFFNLPFIIILIQFFNLILIILSWMNKENKNNICLKEVNISSKFKAYLISLNEQKNYKWLIIFTFFIITLLGLCISVFNSEIPIDNDFTTNYNDYKNLFTFFIRVPLIFYFFLISMLLLMVYILIFSQSNITRLTVIILFLYIVWILPYLQIKGFFSRDTYTLFNFINLYPEKGIFPGWGENGLLVFDGEYHIPHRYSTSFFTSILLVEGTNLDISFYLWFIYPINNIFIVFFFFSVFREYISGKKENEILIHKNNIRGKKINIIIITLLALISPQFIKFAHSATTGVLGIYIFFILVYELYNLITKDSKGNWKNYLLILLLFFFLCLTHIEECISFIILVFITIPSYIFYNNLREREDYQKNVLKLTIFLSLILFLFYTTQEFFGWLIHYPSYFLSAYDLDFLLKIYDNTSFKPNLINLRGTFSLNILLLIFISIGPLIFSFITLILIKNYQESFIEISRKIIIFLNKIVQKFNIILKKKYLKYIFYIAIYFVIFLIYCLFMPWRTQEIIILILDIVLSFTIIIFHMVLFFRGFKDYKKNRIKQHYYLFAIIAVASTFLLFILVNELYWAIYIINARFFSFFIFFNLIIIQNNYFNSFLEKNKKKLFTIIFLLLLTAFYYSFRSLSFG